MENTVKEMGDGKVNTEVRDEYLMLKWRGEMKKNVLE